MPGAAPATPFEGGGTIAMAAQGKQRLSGEFADAFLLAEMR
jgi:hypothetical protein